MFGNNEYSNNPSGMSGGAGMWGAIAGAAQGLIGTIGQGFVNRRNRRFSKEMWNKQNWYNHPINQMQRLKDAGLNPNLVYGSGSATHQASTANVPKGEFKEPDIMGAIMQYQNIKNQGIQEEILRKEMNKRHAEALYWSTKSADADFEYTNKLHAYQKDPSPFIGAKTADQQMKIDRALQQAIFTSNLQDVIDYQQSQRLADVALKNANKSRAQQETELKRLITEITQLSADNKEVVFLINQIMQIFSKR